MTKKTRNIRTLLKNRLVLNKLLIEFSVNVINKKETESSISYIIEDSENVSKLIDEFKIQTNHPLIII